MAGTPDEIGRNEFDEWCWRRGLDLRAVSDGLKLVAARLSRDTGRLYRGPSLETVRWIRLPFSDPRRRVPGEDVLELIRHYTGGAILPAHFYPPHLRGAPAAEAPSAPEEAAA